MKTNRSISLSIFLSLILVLSSGDIFGQGRSNRGRSDNFRTSSPNGNSRYEKNSGKEKISNANSRNERSSYNYSRNSSSVNNNIYEYTPKESNHDVNKKQSNYYLNGNQNYAKEYHHYVHSHINTYSYHRPVTYHTWHYPAPWEYAPHAIVFRHDHGNYFFHHGRFYRYHPVRGYYRVDIPSTVRFRNLPVGYEEVFIGGGMYYRYGEVFFEYSPWGYRIMPRPSGIIVSARF
jgi:hypothetical protein